jgi:hypothetical protein
MNARATTKIVAAALAAGFVLALTTIWREYPGWGPSCEGDCFVAPPPAEYAVKLAVGLLSLISVAAVAIKAIPTRKVLAASLACAVSGAVGLFLLSGAIARVFGQYKFPDLLTLVAVSTVTGVVGALAAWAWVGGGLTNRWSGRVKDKVPSSYTGVRAAQLNR